MDETKNDFQRQFPGPFEVNQSTEGVDNTYIVCCKETNRVLLSFRFWAKLPPSEVELKLLADAQLVTDLLNFLHHREEQPVPPSIPEWLPEANFVVEHYLCPGYGLGWSLRDAKSNRRWLRDHSGRDTILVYRELVTAIELCDQFDYAAKVFDGR